MIQGMIIDKKDKDESVEKKRRKKCQGRKLLKNGHTACVNELVQAYTKKINIFSHYITFVYCIGRDIE